METIKEEKKADLEQLLNSLIEKGWKPRGYEMHGIHCSTNRFTLYLPNMIQGNYSLRDLVSKESGLWMFVCENDMVKNVNDYSWELYDGTHGQHEVYKNSYEGGVRWEQVDYEYRLIESALKDESELEQFLLSNIRVD